MTVQTDTTKSVPTIKEIEAALAAAGLKTEIASSGSFDSYGRWNDDGWENIHVVAQGGIVRVDGRWTGLDNPEADTWRVVVDDEWSDDNSHVVTTGKEYLITSTRTHANLSTLVDAVREAVGHWR